MTPKVRSKPIFSVTIRSVGPCGDRPRRARGSWPGCRSCPSRARNRRWFSSKADETRSSRSCTRSWIQRHARLPTVVAWAGWKWVKPSVGSAFHSRANEPSGSQRADQLTAQEPQTLAHDDDVGVVPDVAGGGGPEVDDRPRLGAALPPGVHVGHHVVAQLLLVARGQQLRGRAGRRWRAAPRSAPRGWAPRRSSARARARPRRGRSRACARW